VHFSASSSSDFSHPRRPHRTSWSPRIARDVQYHSFLSLYLSHGCVGAFGPIDSRALRVHV
jgi:hypothetical protein